MKALAVVLVLLFTITEVVSQPSLKGKMMPDSNAIWVYDCVDNYNPPLPPLIYRHRYSVENIDTIITSKTYHKFYGGINNNKLYLGAYRNDTLTRIAYVIPKDSISEYKWFDFSLNLGDTITNLLFFNEYSYSFDLLDSVFVSKIDTHQNVGTKTWDMQIIPRGSSFPFDFQFTEGLGITLLYKGIDYGCGIQCFIHNGYYYLGQQGSCLNVGIEEQVNELKIELYPNPVTSTSTLTIDKIGDIKSVCIYDVFGRKVKEYHPANSIAINSTEFKSGIYFYSVITTQKNYSGRFLVQ